MPPFLPDLPALPPDTAKKLASLAAGSAAILVRRIAEARNGPRQIY